MVKFLVDNREIKAEQGTILLQACLDNGIYIPNLCYLKGLDRPTASCRMCFVEIEGEDKPTPSCTVEVREGMVVKTSTPYVRRLQRTGLRLLLSVHKVDCARCPANKKCELQRIAKFLKVGLKPIKLEPFLKETEIDDSHPFMIYYPNRCILCGKCLHVCRKKNGHRLLTFAKRGIQTVVSFYGEEKQAQLDCNECIACVQICPVSALTLKPRSDRRA